MKLARAYTMRARAESAAATRERVRQAASEAMRERFRPDIRLDDVAARAGVSPKTVLRCYGSLRALLDAVAEQAVVDVARGFEDVPPGDLDAVVAAYFTHYEELGDLVVRNVRDETDPDVHRFVERGRRAHREGVERLFAPQLAGLASARRRHAVDALVCALDVHTWKLLRRDLGRSRRDAEATVRQLVQGVVTEGCT